MRDTDRLKGNQCALCFDHCRNTLLQSLNCIYNLHYIFTCFSFHERAFSFICKYVSSQEQDLPKWNKLLSVVSTVLYFPTLYALIEKEVD